MRRVHHCVLLTLIMFAQAACAEPPVGIAVERPAKGFSVQTKDGWMVSYTERIPGTDVHFTMIPVPGGTFLLGSPEDEVGHKADESPQVKIEVSPMWVGKCEVTQQEYNEYKELYTRFQEFERSNPEFKDVDRDRPDVVSAPTAVYDPKYSDEYAPDPTHPAVSMTQYAAQQYTKWLSIVTQRQYRLPTEAEWEYVCRAGSNEAFSWGHDEELADRFAWHFANTDDVLGHVGKKAANAWGIHDMHGNAGEWTVSAYTPNGYASLAAKSQGKAAKSQGKMPNALDVIVWPDEKEPCVVRGGTFDSDLVDQRCAARLVSDEEWANQDADYPRSPWWYSSDPARQTGFRVFRSLEPIAPDVLSKFWNHTSESVRATVQYKLEGGRGAIGVLDVKTPGRPQRDDP